MLRRMTRFVFAFVAVAALFSSTSAFSQTPGSRSALAAKQHIKTAVLDAMADGSISKLERAEILAEASNMVTVKEYEGLKATMDRLSPPENATAEATRTVSDRVALAAKKQQQESPIFLSKMFSRVPYIEDLSLGPHPQMNDVAKSMPYMKPRSIDTSGVRQALAKTSRWSETYIESPSATRPLPKVTHVEKRSAPVRTADKRSQPRKTQANAKRPAPKYADESVSPSIGQAEAVETSMTRQPRKFLKAMSPLAESSYLENDREAMVMPVGAVLPDRSVPATSADYVKPMQPEELEAEFLR